MPKDDTMSSAGIQKTVSYRYKNRKNLYVLLAVHATILF